MINYSIVIPHKNNSDTLERLLNSIPQREDIEVFIIDDFSDKNHLEELKKLKLEMKNCNLYIENNIYKTAGGARNTALEKIKGKWAIFADSDDFFLNGAFDIFDTFLNSTYDLIFFNSKSIKLGASNDNFEPGIRHLYFNKLLTSYLEFPNEESEFDLKYKYVVPWGKMIRVNLINQHSIKFDESLVGNDVMFSTKVSFYSKKMGASKKNVYMITERENNLSSKKDKKSLSVRNDIFIKQNKFLKSVLNEDQLVDNRLKSKFLIGSSIKNGGILFGFKEFIKMKRNKVQIFGIWV